MFLPTFLDQSVEHLLAWHVNLSHTNVNLLNTKMLYRRSVQQNYISNIKLFDRMTLVLFNRFSVKIFQQIDMCDRFTPWFSVQQICKLAKLSVQICWTNQLMVDAVIYWQSSGRSIKHWYCCILIYNSSYIAITIWRRPPLIDLFNRFSRSVWPICKSVERKIKE